MFRYPINQRLEITLRHLRGEKAVDLSREFKIPERQIRRWKRIAVEAIDKRLRGQLTFDGSTLHYAQLAMRRLHKDVMNWKPDFHVFDSITIPADPNPEARYSKPEAPPSAHNAAEEENRIR